MKLILFSSSSYKLSTAQLPNRQFWGITSALNKIQEFCSRLERGLVQELPPEVPVKRQELLDIYLKSLLNILDQSKDLKICEILAKRIWCVLEYGKQHALMNETNSNMFQTLMGYGGEQ